MSNPSHQHIIGYALPPKTEETFIQPSLLSYCNQHGIVLLKIDPNKPLIDQGPFDCIIHKLYGQDWTQQLQHFSSKNPNVPIIDSPKSIERLHNRISMLEVVANLKTRASGEKFGIPKQVLVSDSEALLSVSNEKLGFPMIAKPLVADGSVNSHRMYLVFDNEGLTELSVVPVVLQEFVNHGGVIFKVYVVGEHAKCVKRRSLPDITEERLVTLRGSLPDITEERLVTLRGSLPFSQISNLSVGVGEESRSEGCGDVESAEMPPLGFVEEMARALREAMGLNLFNFDVIRDAKDPNRYLVIDINYFPGYAKMPDYEAVLTHFFLDVVNKKKMKNA